MFGNFEFVQELLSRDANVDVQNKVYKNVTVVCFSRLIIIIAGVVAIRNHIQNCLCYSLSLLH